jgi:hypothetical protein
LGENARIDNVARMASMAAASSACVIVGTLPPVFKSADVKVAIAHPLKWNGEIRSLVTEHRYLVADCRVAMEGKRGLFADSSESGWPPRTARGDRASPPGV